MTASQADGSVVQIGELVIGGDMDEFARWELQQKEWCPITIEMNGQTLRMEVISLYRFGQEARDNWQNGWPAIIDEATLILEKVDFDSVVAEVERLYRSGWFNGRLTANQRN